MNYDYNVWINNGDFRLKFSNYKLRKTCHFYNSALTMSAHPELLHDKVALVTGASSGNGEAIARLLVILGVHVIGLARRGERLNKIANSLEGAKGTFDPYPGDVRNESNILDAFAYAAACYKGIDILVNNAGIIYVERITESSTFHLRNMLDTNLLAAAITNREAVKSMRKKSGSGHIVNIVSIVGLNPTLSSNGRGLYTPSKVGLHALTENLRQEMTQSGIDIKVTGIYPGVVDTDLWPTAGIPSELIRKRPHLEASDIADAVVYALTRPGNIQINQMVVEPLHATYGNRV